MVKLGLWLVGCFCCLFLFSVVSSLLPRCFGPSRQSLISSRGDMGSEQRSTGELGLYNRDVVFYFLMHIGWLEVSFILRKFGISRDQWLRGGETRSLMILYSQYRRRWTLLDPTLSSYDETTMHGRGKGGFGIDTLAKGYQAGRSERMSVVQLSEEGALGVHNTRGRVLHPRVASARI